MNQEVESAVTDNDNGEHQALPLPRDADLVSTDQLQAFEVNLAFWRRAWRVCQVCLEGV